MKAPGCRSPSNVMAGLAQGRCRSRPCGDWGWRGPALVLDLSQVLEAAFLEPHCRCTHTRPHSRGRSAGLPWARVLPFHGGPECPSPGPGPGGFRRQRGHQRMEGRGQQGPSAGGGLGSQLAVWTPERVELLFWGSSVLGLFGAVTLGRSGHGSGVWRGVQVAVPAEGRHSAPHVT